ncbi:hypothetical protein [Flavobacterium sp. N502540]|uniref:hypothetical protein n=1 Tax=Flavobacterium sp. N502540 TaxID=2986838 RepID=UPI002224240D|nr:hypothetical protein [Flavobacterium sp. N502540]
MDSNFINASEKKLFKISNNQKTAILASRIEIENGNFHKNEDVISEMREWLKNKKM